MNTEVKFLRRKAAAAYLNNKYGFGTDRSLAKMATTGGGPAFRKFSRFALYEPAALDAWAESRISAPRVSTSDAA